MLRRKLTAYTVMYIAGIAAGYFMLIEIRPVEGTCFMIACALAVLFSDMAEIEKRALILFLLMGFMLFVIHFAFGGSPSDETYTEDAPVEENILFDAREGFIDNFDEDTGAFIKGVVFGDKADIDDSLKSLFSICVNTKHDIEVNSADDFDYKYNFRNSDAKWIVEIEVDGIVYIVPYDNEELIGAINVKLMPPTAHTVKHNGVEILVESDACGVIVYKLRIGYKFVAFDNLDSAKKFIENNVKGE